MLDRRTQGARPQASPLELWVSALFCFASLVIVILCVSDYGINWMHPEVFLVERKHLVGLTGLHWRDLARFFDCEILSDVCTRARFLSFLTGYVDSFFRLWLVQYIPPHPSITITWLLSLASLYFLYRTIVLLTEDPAAALLGVGLYALSAGFLSSMLMLFNPAKALAGFFVNFCLFLATRIWRSPDKRACSPAAVILYVSLFLAYCSDETCWFLSGAIPILLMDSPRRRDWPFLACVAATFPLFLAFVTWVAPAIIELLWGYQHFDFWSWAFNVGRAADPNEPPLLTRLSVPTLAAIAYNMLQSEYAWPHSGPTVAALSVLPLAAAVVAAAGLANREMRWLLARTTIVLAMFVVFQSLLLLRHYVAAGTYYYGALFANFSLLVVAVAISCVRRAGTAHGARAARALACLAAIYLGYVSFSWCMAFNRYWIGVHDKLYAEMVPDLYGPLTPGAPLSEAKVAAYWRAARTGEDFRRLRASFAPKDIWLFAELDAWRRRQGLDR